MTQGEVVWSWIKIDPLEILSLQHLRTFRRGMRFALYLA